MLDQYNTKKYSISLLQGLLKDPMIPADCISYCENYPTDIYDKGIGSIGFDDSFPLSYYLGHYEELAGSEDLRRKIAERESNKYKYRVSFKNVAMTKGATHALYCACKMVLSPADEVIVQVPAYSGFAQIQENFNVILKELPMDNNLPDIKQLKNIITKKTRMLIINSPHNPTGNVFSAETLREIMDVCRHYSILLLHDEVYDDLVYDNNKISSSLSCITEDLPQDVIKINSFSKNYGLPGLRVGWIVANEKIILEIEKLIERTVLSVNPFSQKVASKLLHMNYSKMVEICKQRRDILCGRLENIPRIKYKIPSSGTLVYVDIGELKVPSLLFVKKLAEKHGVLFLPSEAYFGADDHHIRLSFGYGESAILKFTGILKDFIENNTKVNICGM